MPANPCVTIDDLLRGLKAAWDEDSTIGNGGIAGPYLTREPVKAAPGFPYTVVDVVSFVPNHRYAGGTVYKAVIRISVYDTTLTLVSGHVANIGGVFDGNCFSLAAGKGSIIQARQSAQACAEEDVGVFRGMLTMEYLHHVPET